MKKFLALTCFVLCLKNAAQAQVDTRPFVFSLSPEVSVPVGTFGETNKIGFGGNISGQFYLGEKLRALAIFGGGLHQGKSYVREQYFDTEYPAVALMGLKAGLKYYLTGGIFVAGTIGIDNVKQDGQSKFGFGYAPILGVELGGVDLHAKYNSFGVKSTEGGSIQTVGFSIGYRL